MAQFWRPFDVDEDEDQATGIQISGKPDQKKTRCSVTPEEEKIVLAAYKTCTGGWNEMLQFVQSKVEEIKSGDVMKQSKTREYYRMASNKSAIKRIQRIINKKAEKAKDNELPSTSSGMIQSDSMANSIKRAEKAKDNELPSTSSGMIQSDSMANSIKRAKVRYSQKATPEERKQQKLDLMSLEDSCSSDDLNDKTMLPEVNKDMAQESKPPGVSKKRKRNRGKATKESHEAHTKMCECAMGMMDKISKVLEKFESESD